MPADHPRLCHGSDGRRTGAMGHVEQTNGGDVTTDGDRIDALETHLAFQGDTIRQLNDALVAQHDRIDRLQAEFERVIATVQREASGAANPPADERPPHY